MTKSQERTLKRVKNAIPRNFFHTDNYEIKDIRVEEYEHFLL